MDISNNFFTEMVVKHPNRLLRKVDESPCLQVSKDVHVALRDTVSWWPWQCWVNGVT